MTDLRPGYGLAVWSSPDWRERAVAWLQAQGYDQAGEFARAPLETLLALSGPHYLSLGG